MHGKKRATLGVAMVAKNEAKRLKKSLSSVPFADQIVILDVQSTDATVAIAKELGAQVFTEKDTGIRNMKQRALELLKTDWILALDPDEWLSPEAQQEIKTLLESDNVEEEAFMISRFNLLWGRTILHGRGADYPVRLVKRGCAEYTNVVAHETLVVKGKVGLLRGPVDHDTTPHLDVRIQKMIYETNLEIAKGNPPLPTVKDIFLNPVIYFFSMLIKKAAWRDGIPGVILLALFSIQIFYGHAKMYEYHQLKNEKKT